MITRSGLALLMICAIAALSGPACTQHMQPPASWRTCSVDASPAAALLIATASMPTAPNSFTMTTHTSSGGLWAARWQRAVVLPTASAPVIIVTGMGSLSFRDIASQC